MSKSFKINALLNSIKKCLSLLFPLVTYPYVLRVIGSTEFGKINFSNSIIGYVMLFASFGISSYAVREGARIRDNKERINEFISDLFTFNLISTILSLAVFFLLIFFNTKLFEYRDILLIQSLSIVLTALGVDWVNTIYEDYLYITIRYIVIQILAIALIFAFVKSETDTLIYCLILVFATYGGNLINLIYIKKYVHIRINFNIDFKKYFKPLFTLFVNSFATVIYVNSDITMLGFYTSDSIVGIYSLASKIYNIIKQFINAIMLVAIPRLAQYIEKDNTKYILLLQKLFNAFVITLLPITIGVFMMSDSLIMIVGGKTYVNGSPMLKVLSVAILFALVSSLFTNCILILNRLEQKCLVGTVISATINVVLNMVLIPIMGGIGAAITTVIAEFVNMIIQAFYAKKYLKITFLLQRKCVVKTFIYSIIVIVICLLIKNICVMNNLYTSVIAVFITILSSGILCLLINSIFNKSERNNNDHI